MNSLSSLNRSAQVYIRNDNILEQLLIFFLSFVLYKISPINYGGAKDFRIKSLIRFGMSFDDFVEVSKVSIFIPSLIVHLKLFFIDFISNKLWYSRCQT